MPAHRLRRLAFISSKDAYSLSSWSGTYHFMARALERHFEIIHFGAQHFPLLRSIGKGINRVGGRLIGPGFDAAYTQPYARLLARHFDRLLKGVAVDAIFSPETDAEVAWLRPDLPLLYVSDSTFVGTLGYYFPTDTYPQITAHAAKALQQRVFSRACALSFSSAWATNSALDDYDVPAQKTITLPFGANLDEALCPRPASPRRLTPGKPLNLLFIGKCWRRKGGSVAYDAVVRLNEIGVPATLTICGCQPPALVVAGAHVRVLPPIDKASPDGMAAIAALYQNADFLFVPSRAECYGVVYAEAAAFGVPVIATATGGITSAVSPGVSGLLLSLEAGGGEYADAVAELAADPDRFEAMSAAARVWYEERVNWATWGRDLHDFFHARCI